MEQLTRKQITEILIRHMRAAIAIRTDTDTLDSVKVEFLVDIVGNIANDVDRALSESVSRTTRVG